MARAVVALLGLVVVGILAVQGFDAGLANAGDDRIVEDEQFSPTAGDVTELQHSNQDGTYYDDQAEVMDGNGVRMVDGEDYLWYEGNGTVKTLAGGDLDGETDATITYRYQVPSENQRGIAEALGVIPRFLEVGIIIAGVILLLVFLKL